MLEIKHLRKEYPNATPLKDINCVINKGDVISLIGPSGTGKSTLLRCINQLETATSGEIIFEGKNILKSNKKEVCELRKKIGMVFQSFNLFNHLTVLENIVMPQVDLLKENKQKAYETAMDLLKLVGLEDKKDNYIDELSGGQKQRIAIARTLAMGNEIILFDEPTSALDPTMVGEVENVILDLAKQGKTMLIVTHDMSFVKQVSKKVFFMSDGLIYEEGTPKEIFEHPQKVLTKKFISNIK